MPAAVRDLVENADLSGLHYLFEQWLV